MAEKGEKSEKAYVFSHIIWILFDSRAKRAQKNIKKGPMLPVKQNAHDDAIGIPFDTRHPSSNGDLRP